MLLPNPCDKYIFVGDASSGIATKNSATNIDYKITDDNIYLNGAEIGPKNSVLGDWIEFQIVDVDNIFGYGAGTVLDTFLKKWYINPLDNDSLDLPYAANVPKNLYIRLIYHSTGTSEDVPVYINYQLHKKV